MIHEYIRKMRKKEYDFLNRCKTDLESSLELKDRVSNEKKEELIDAVIKLIEIALKDEKELEGFLEILDVSMKFNVKIKELKILKNQLKGKITKGKK